MEAVVVGGGSGGGVDAGYVQHLLRFSLLSILPLFLSRRPTLFGVLTLSSPSLFCRGSWSLLFLLLYFPSDNCG